MNRRFVLCIVVLISFTAIFARLAELPGVAPKNTKTWIEYAANGFAGGSGTQEDPYRIATAGQLAYLAKTVNEGNMYQDCYFEQTKDIDLGKHEWVPIGTGSGVYFRTSSPGWKNGPPGFNGNFDGKNKAIHGLHIKQFWGFSGLFGVIRDGSLKNIKLTSVNIENGYCSGGIVGTAFLPPSTRNDPDSPSGMTDCSVEGTVAGFWLVGGMAGALRGFDELSGGTISVDLKSTYDKREGYKFALYMVDSSGEETVYGVDESFFKQVSPLFDVLPPYPYSFETYAGGVVAWLRNENTGIDDFSVKNSTVKVRFSGDISLLGSIAASHGDSQLNYTNTRTEINKEGVESTCPPEMALFWRFLW